MRKTKNLWLIAVLVLALTSCQENGKSKKGTFSVDYEKYTLANGMDVVLHQDASDPIVSVAIQYHVGSNREVPGKTGFAHLFEHMMFQQSEHVGQDQFFKIIQGAGGDLNGGTSRDGTIYYEVVPKNALETVLWLESDRMGYLDNTVTQSAFANQQNVVQNEKRQRVDNQPYGHNSWVIDKNLYPEGHPYNWEVIGEMEDLFNATVEDVKAFHKAYYGPNNATLVIAGDFDAAEVKSLVEKYFGEIPGGEKMKDLDPMPVTLDQTKKLYHEDNFATTPLFTMVYPTVQDMTPDAYALQFLGELLSSGKKSPFYKVLVKEKKLTSNARVYSMNNELAGEFTIRINANAGTDLKEVEAAIFEAFERFETDGITENDLERVKAGLETGFYNGISSILGKAFQLARYNEYAGEPSFIEQDIANIQAVTIDDILRVYNQYIKGKPYVATSFVPKGELSLIAENSVPAGIVEENVMEAVEVEQDNPAGEEVIEKTPTAFDRDVQPAFGPDPVLNVPSVWTGSLDNGIKIFGIEQHEVPLVQYTLYIKGGHLLDDIEKPGVAKMVADLMTEGTANRTPEELEEAIDLLGAYISVSAGTEGISINVNTLARNFEKTLALVEEMLLEPRWDEEQFELAKIRIINGHKRNMANPSYLASRTFSKTLFGENSLLSTSVDGTAESIEAITMDDLKAYYEKNFSPSVSSFMVVGDIGNKRVNKALEDLNTRWEAKEVDIPVFDLPAKPEQAKIYFVDVPGAKQSVIYIGNLALKHTDPDFFPVDVVNYKLGGSFNGILNMILREEKGFTYGARSGFSGNNTYGYFVASSSVRSNATEESVQIFKDEMMKYREGISQDDLNFTKDALIKSNALRFETLWALLDMVSNICLYDLPFDYVKQEESFITNLTVEQHKELAQKYINPDKMYYIVVGDAATQMKALEAIGFGKPELVKL